MENVADNDNQRGRGGRGQREVRGGGRGGQEEGGGRGRGGRGGQGGGEGQGEEGGGGERRRRMVISNECGATVVDQVVNHGLSMREAGQRVQPNLSRFTVAAILWTFRRGDR